ncbi:TetR/AcrR family transcriptional regulator [Dermatobacter hominis]|uniref:TetR/AcrR family transcriptional regulator n=1 Tax=Dermatobacter hominis TaxID=2884263 RepID=UPI001D1270CA|nr:TetR/AcrR family transcriptional regulator [Dermatobacter hominis]UDY36577.1 TetR/AcrR family transcriptional regulator [Dermatobacter hominis]
MLSEHSGAVQRPQGAEEAVDGRSARRSRGRAAAIDAVLELFDLGELRPSADVVVERAGISTASLFRYFRGLDELYRAAFEEQVARAQLLARIDAPEDLPLDERVARFLAGRIDVYESVAGVGRMARARAVDHDDVAVALDLARGRWLVQVRQVFAPELAGRTRAEARSLAAAVDAVASFEAWDLLVGARGTPRRAVEAHWTTALTALLA